jgi:hypothetical protein
MIFLVNALRREKFSPKTWRNYEKYIRLSLEDQTPPMYPFKSRFFMKNDEGVLRGKGRGGREENKRQG